MSTIDLNCDLGETVAGRPTADDAALFRIVTSANVACGFHAGDERSMRESCLRAADHGVMLGAHVSYRDVEGFGRRPMEVAAETLLQDLAEQLAALSAAAAAAGIRVSYIKPHGALYNRIVLDEEQARSVVRFAVGAGLPLLGLVDSAVHRIAVGADVAFHSEAFADRGYRADGSLVPRGESGAVITDVDVVAARAVRIATAGSVVSVDGSRVDCTAESLCVHGDTPDSVGLARAVRAALEGAGVRVASFA